MLMVINACEFDCKDISHRNFLIDLIAVMFREMFVAIAKSVVILTIYEICTIKPVVVVVFWGDRLQKA